jgi:glycosyltransferase involved in cell wall biosynthesis
VRLVIDARMLDHSGIGTYLANILPGVLERCAALDPVVLTLPDLLQRAAGLASSSAEVLPWEAAPLSAAEWRSPPFGAAGDLWWAPHFNVPLRSSLPLVVTLHDLLPLTGSGGRWPPHKRLAVHAWLAAVRRRARRVICASEFTRGEAIRLGRIDAATISVVPLGVDPDWAAGATPPAPASIPYLLFVGLVKPHKNLRRLLLAFEAIAPMIPHRLIVVGRHTGLRGVDAAALALARRLAPRVELVECLPRAQLAAMVAGAELLVQPSLYEGFGLPPLEAMAAGTPVLAARAGALPEVCGDAALYCDPGSAADIGRGIREALGDDQLRARLRARGRERVRAFTWRACAQATADLLLTAAGDAPRRGRTP